MLPAITAEFRVASDPEIKYSQGGSAYTRFRAVADKKKKVDDQWVDDKVFWASVTCFGETAENVAESVMKGALVTVTGRIETREYEVDGQKRTSVDIAADTVALSLARDSYAGATPRASQGGQNRGQQAPAENPWGGGTPTEEPPF